jgi:hypothetical protein
MIGAALNRHALAIKVFFVPSAATRDYVDTSDE